MLVEVAKSIEIAYELCELFNRYDVDMEYYSRGLPAESLHWNR